MWAQMIKDRVKPGQESASQQLQQEMEARFQGDVSGRGPNRVIVMQDQNDTGTYITVIFFESEAQARENELSPEVAALQERMMQIWEGPPEFTDLNVIHELNR